jgi:hypothetical protein
MRFLLDSGLVDGALSDDDSRRNPKTVSAAVPVHDPCPCEPTFTGHSRQQKRRAPRKALISEYVRALERSGRVIYIAR